MTPALSAQSVSLDGLPKKFLHSLRTLFDILDDKATGFVSLSDIETRWKDDGTKGVPKGVIECLRKVTPPNGLLSFERFCAGLKICLLRNQIESQNKSAESSNKQDNENDTAQLSRPPSAPILDADTQPKWTSANTATVRPTQQRTISMPHLTSENKEKYGGDVPEIVHNNNQAPIKQQPVLYGPPKPPRLVQDRVLDKAEIRLALQHWQLEQMMNDQDDKKLYTVPVRAVRSIGDGKPASSNFTDQTLNKKVLRRREPRRHTLQNGVDFNMLKKIKQIEQEKDALMEGLQAVERAREWYLKQISAVQEKMSYIGKLGSQVEQWSEAQQERIELQRARILEVNRHLSNLIDSSERGGLPFHMNLAVHTSPTPNLLAQLKQQNHLLTKEVNQKNEKITLLEREKACLVRELYHTRRRSKLPSNENAAYI